MSVRAWRVFLAVQIIAVCCALFTPVVIIVTREATPRQVVFLGVSVFTIVVTRWNYQRMRALHLDWLLRRDNLYRRLRHAQECGDLWDEALTLDLMYIWKIKPPDRSSSR